MYLTSLVTNRIDSATYSLKSDSFIHTICLNRCSRSLIFSSEVHLINIKADFLLQYYWYFMLQFQHQSKKAFNKETEGMWKVESLCSFSVQDNFTSHIWHYQEKNMPNTAQNTKLSASANVHVCLNAPDCCFSTIYLTLLSSSCNSLWVCPSHLLFFSFFLLFSASKPLRDNCWEAAFIWQQGRWLKGEIGV